MIAALLALLGALGSMTDAGGFFIDHPHFWQHQEPEGAMKARCANAFKSYDADSGLWTDYRGKYHHCPPNT